jgi:transposase
VFGLTARCKIYVCRQPVDMRKSFDGLAAATLSYFGQQPDSGHYFVFISRRLKIVKILSWEGDGYAIWSKRLEQGQFNLPKNSGGDLLITRRELNMLLDGVKPGGFYKRYAKKQ